MTGSDADRLRLVELRIDELASDTARLGADLEELTEALLLPSPEPAAAAPTDGPGAVEQPRPPAASGPPQHGATPDPGTPPVGFPPLTDDLTAWTEQVLLPTFPRIPGGEIRWCTRWNDHPEAVIRFAALHRAWLALRDEPLGPATWLTSYLDPVLAALLAPSGTFAACTPTRHRET